MQNNHGSVQHLLHTDSNLKKKILKAFTDWENSPSSFAESKAVQSLSQAPKGSLREIGAWSYNTRSAWEASASLPSTTLVPDWVKSVPAI